MRTKEKAPYGLGNEGITCWQDQEDALQKEKKDEKSKAPHVMAKVTRNLKNVADLNQNETYLAMFK